MKCEILPQASLILACLPFAIWIYLFLGRGRFWRSAPELTPAIPQEYPDIDVLVPARDEAETIAAAIASLLAQDYAGKVHITLIDDNSIDGTGSLAGSAPNLRVLRLISKPAGWSGKLWALEEGLRSTTAPLVFLTDADITHDARHLSTLVAKLCGAHLGMVSEMVRLNCGSTPERALVPAFVYFFQMLYPFSKVNDVNSTLSAAAGGSILIRRELLTRLGGFEAIRGTLIDDVALARAAKKIDAVFLGHSGLATSIRRYPRFADIWNMITRTAFTQLKFSAILLCMTILGLALIWWAPIVQLIVGSREARIASAGSCLLAVGSYLPTLRRYRRSPLWAMSLPLIAAFYIAATIASAVNHWRGAGSRWKRRSYENGPLPP